ncbi:MAG: carotenoid oxygenase family protein [Pseudanabaena sp. ELA607]
MAQVTGVDGLASFARDDWQGGYRSLYVEHDYWVEAVDGQIPADLRGTFLRNGPGLLDVGGERYGHPFDGDGMICALRFDGGRAHFRNRFVKTPEFLAEQKAGRILYRGVFGTHKPGGWWRNAFDLRIKNLANTNVVYQGEKLLALWEAALPYRLDAESLDTVGLENFGGALQSGATFTAHPRRDGVTGDLWAFGVQTGPRSVIRSYRVDPQGNLHEEFAQPIDGFAFLHDFAYTPNYRIFMQNPVKFNPLPFVLGLATAGSCIELQPDKPSLFLIFDRQGNLISVPTDPCFVFHHCNAFERGDELVVDSVCYGDYPKLEPNSDFLDVDFARVVPGQLYRFVINLKTKTVHKSLLVERSCEFPVIHPRCMGRDYRYAYIGATAGTVGNAPLQAVLKVDVTTGAQELHSFAPRGFVGEPIFVPRNQETNTAEDDGWVLVMVYDAAQNRSDVVILDAQNITAAPVAVLHLKHHVPYGLHGCFVPDLV